MDLITDLSCTANGYDSIWVVIDRLIDQFAEPDSRKTRAFAFAMARSCRLVTQSMQQAHRRWSQASIGKN
jgi:hypothetical protein